MTSFYLEIEFDVSPVISPAETGCSGMYEKRHDPRDGPQLQSLQTQQAPDFEGGTHDREAGETAEARARKEAETKTSGDLYLKF